jgi:nucleoside 2-deoxyribosyltransferase
MKTVYLAGPITGLTYDEGQDWRLRMTRQFGSLQGVQALSPLRGKSYLKDAGTLGFGDYSKVHPLSSDVGIVTRDLNDVRRADVIIANVLGAQTASPGTCMEIGAAYEHHIPVILVIEPEDNPHDRHMVRGGVGYRVDNLDDAWAIAATILGFDVVIPAQKKSDIPPTEIDLADALDPEKTTWVG